MVPPRRQRAGDLPPRPGPLDPADRRCRRPAGQGRDLPALFGEARNVTVNPIAQPETQGYVGERFDAGPELQFLNARYYDPKLSLFTSPDWLDVTIPGVGTNRYAYAGNSPVNNSDPGGNCPSCIGAVVGALVGGLVELANDLSDGNISHSATQYAAAVGGGAVIGMTGGAAAPALLGERVAIGAATGVLATNVDSAARYGTQPGLGAQVIGAIIGGVSGCITRPAVEEKLAVGTFDLGSRGSKNTLIAQNIADSGWRREQSTHVHLLCTGIQRHLLGLPTCMSCMTLMVHF
nr:RHS repeat-associated core domain-containing protein [Amaricoccus sp.]